MAKFFPKEKTNKQNPSSPYINTINIASQNWAKLAPSA
jgi:hypothetical protein